MRSFLLSEKSGSGAFRATVHHPPRGYDALAVKRGEQAPPERLEFRWKMGAKMPGDILLTDDVELLVSTRFLKSIEGRPGWRSIPVSLILPSGRRVQDFQSLVVVGRTGQFLQDRTTKLPAHADKVFDTYKGLCFSMPEVFGVCMPMQFLNFVYVSEGFVSAVSQYTSGAIEFIPCEEVITDPWMYLSVVEKTSERRSK